MTATAGSRQATMTFLFTDIVGSTDLWENHGDAFLPVLQTHNAILSEAIQRNGGHLMKTEGDSFKAAFENPAAAIRCAMVAQAAMERYPWPPDIGRIRVRMGVHTGQPFAQCGDYFGPPVNRTARIMAAANGGQTLISEETLQQAGEAVREAANVTDLGFHRLRDLDEPIRLYDCSPSILARRPAPRPKSLNAHALSLPMQRTSFIGRQAEIEKIAHLLSRNDVRCLQVTGPQGVGKTRLSLQVAAERVDRFPDGVWFIRLTDCATAEEAAEAVAHTLGLRIRPGRSATAELRDWISARECLLILDDCGRIPEAGSFIHRLLSGAASLRCLATSAEALDLDGITVLELGGLGVPEPDAGAAEVIESDSGRLFVERAQEAIRTFQLTDPRARIISSLLRKLDGLPGAIEKTVDLLRTHQNAPEGILSTSEQAAPSAGGAPRRPIMERILDGSALAALLPAIGDSHPPTTGHDEADQRTLEALRQYHRIGDMAGIADSLRDLGRSAAVRRSYERAAILLQGALEAYREVGSPIVDRVEKELDEVRNALGVGVRPESTTLSKAIALATAKES